MSEPRTVVIMGVSGSGKSTVARSVAKRLGWAFAEADVYHPPENVAKMAGGEPLTDDDRTPWLHILRNVIESSLDRGESIVLACSALKAEFRAQLLEGNDAMFVYLKGDRDLIERRMQKRRGHFMSPAMIDSQFAALEEPKEAFIVDVTQDLETIIDAVVDTIEHGAHSGRDPGHI